MYLADLIEKESSLKGRDPSLTLAAHWLSVETRMLLLGGD